MLRAFLLLSTIFLSQNVWARVTEYQISIQYKIVNVTGKSVQVIALGKIGEEAGVPAPTLEFTEGDIARITFTNNIDRETSVHWHGILVPNDQDGVPGLTTPGIKPGQSYTYAFPIRQSGTYWYHSHTDLQEQEGVYGAIVIHPQTESLKYDREEVLVLNDWTNRDPKEIMRILKTDSDWEQIRKNTLRTWIEDLEEGSLKARLISELERMGPMDVADVSYDAFLINGHSQGAMLGRPGERIRLRVINASSSTYFRLGFGLQKMQVVAADGQPVAPILVDDIPIAIAETYDVIVTIPNDKTVEFRATSEDVTGFASLYFGSSQNLEKARNYKRPNAYSMTAAAEIIPFQGEDPTDLVQLNYGYLKSLRSTALPTDNTTREIKLNVTGNMWRYVWSFNNKVFSDKTNILVRRGENIRFIFDNKSMMHHPLHLHGHFFRVINGQGDFSPLKHTVDIAPMQKLTIEFEADKEGDWLFHCHNLYHMESGMTRVIRYPDTSGKMNMKGPMKMGAAWYPSLNVMETNQRSEVDVASTSAHYDLGARGEYDYKEGEYKLRAEASRNITPYLDFYAGGQLDNLKNAFGAGAHYKFPLMIDARFGLTNKGIDYSVAKQFALTRHLSLEAKYGREYGIKEYNAFLRYRRWRSLSLEGGYAEHGFEGGLHYTK